MVSSRFFAKGALPTNSAAEVGGIKVIGLPHLSVRVIIDGDVFVGDVFISFIVTNSPRAVCSLLTIVSQSYHVLRKSQIRHHPWGGPKGNRTGLAIRPPTLSLPSWVRRVCSSLGLSSTFLRLRPTSKSAPWRGMCVCLSCYWHYVMISGKDSFWCHCSRAPYFCFIGTKQFAIGNKNLSNGVFALAV